MEMLINLIIQLILGVVGGNAAGAALKDYNLGNLGNTIAGAIGALAEVKFCKPSFRRSQARLAAASISGPLWVKSSAAVRVYFECAAVLCTVRAELMGERIRDKFAVSRRKGMQRFESCHPSMRANASRAGGECS